MDVPENIRLLRRKKLVTELVKGKGMAAQLQTLIRNPPAHDGASTLVAELTREICRSFTQAILDLTSGDGSLQIYQIPTGSACSGDRKLLEDSGETSGKKKKGRRGRYKKSKNSETWSTVSETQEDGGAWRKYGQKNILHTQHPRCYYRCTHKFVQGCKATKQVQRTSDGLYQTTYFGHHTCSDPQRAPRLKTRDASSDTPNDDHHQSMLLEATQLLSLQEDDDGTIVTMKKEEETAQSEISVMSKSPDNNNNNDKYHDGSDYIWEDIMGQSSNDDTSFYACSSTSFNDLDMDFDSHFPIDDPVHHHWF